MKWCITYWNNLEKWLNELNKEQLKSVSKELHLLELSGNRLRLPHSKSLGKGIFELRERSYGYRMYYAFHNETITLLSAGNKNTQKKDIKIARTRQKKKKK